MDRRRFLEWLPAALLPPFAGLQATPATAAPSAAALATVTTRLAAAWRGAEAGSTQHVGIFEADWERRTVAKVAAAAVPGRAHGLLAEPDGGFVAVAYRFGTWLWRLDAQGRPVRRVDLGAAAATRRFSGHVVHGVDGTTLLTTELDPATGQGYVGVRDLQTLEKIDEWRCNGCDPHQLVLDPQGNLIVANGGVLRSPDDRKRDLAQMDSSLVVLDGRNGSVRGQWRLPDRKLSMRHLAYAASAAGEPELLGIALQAEHEDPVRRAEAPVLAIFDGERLSVPSHAAAGGGYAGDIATACGGLVVSCQHVGRALWWRRDAPAQMMAVATLREACALSAAAVAPGAIVVAAALGIGRWHPLLPAALLAWPEPLALDNHWVELAAA